MNTTRIDNDADLKAARDGHDHKSARFITLLRREIALLSTRQSTMTRVERAAERARHYARFSLAPQLSADLIAALCVRAAEISILVGAP